MADPEVPSPFSRFARAYGRLAQSLLGVALLFGTFNVLLLLVPSLRATNAVETPLNIFGVAKLLPAYPGWTAAELTELHNQSRVVFEYEPIVEFRIKPMSGSYVNSSQEGFRSNARQGPWPPARDAFNVFVFGGSTTFGWLLQDEDTIVSRLQDRYRTAGCERPVVFYNFGHPSYISTQEALLLQTMLMRGTVPAVAVFLDGLNDFFFRGEMSFSATLESMMAGTDIRQRMGVLVNLPAYQLARKLNARLFYRPRPLDIAEEEPFFRRIIAQWLTNKAFVEGLSRSYGFRTLFAWQPVPVFRYDLSHHFLYLDHPESAGEVMPYFDLARAYTMMAANRPTLEAQGNFLWLADMQADKKENLYVDRIHYNAKFSAEIADKLREGLDRLGVDSCGR